MKLMHPILASPICWREGRIPVLVAEPPRLFREIVFALSEQSESLEGPFVLSVDDMPLDCGDHLHVIKDFVFLSLEDRKLQNRFHAQVQIMAAEAYLRETEALNQKIENYMELLSQTVAFPVTFLHGDYTAALMKSQKFQPVLDGETPLERLMQYFELYSGLLKEQCFVLVSAKAYFEPEQLRQLYKMAAYQKWNLLLLENHAAQPLEGEDICIVDADLCEFRLDNSGLIL